MIRWLPRNLPQPTRPCQAKILSQSQLATLCEKRGQATFSVKKKREKTGTQNLRDKEPQEPQGQTTIS